MPIKEVYTPVGRHFGDGFNMERFLDKHIIFIIGYIFGEVASYGYIYHCEKSTVSLIVQLLKLKTGYLIFSLTAP